MLRKRGAVRRRGATLAVALNSMRNIRIHGRERPQSKAGASASDSRNCSRREAFTLEKGAYLTIKQRYQFVERHFSRLVATFEERIGEIAFGIVQFDYFLFDSIFGD